jgi:parallel beta helix pectate lyase-like protein
MGSPLQRVILLEYKGTIFMAFHGHGARLSQLVLSGAIGLLLPTSPLSARTWKVLADGSGDASTVQAGIDSAVAADTVLVGPGKYFERITFRGRDIVLRSSAGPAQTILDASDLGGRVVTFEAGESRAALLEGFTITHGLGGILIINSQPSIVGNTITDNVPIQNGGGIWCGADTFFPWFPFIHGNTITNNRANWLCGGVGFLQRMVPEISNNYIADNEATGADGGGIYYTSFDEGAIIRNNIVLNNRAGDHGGGMYIGSLGSKVLGVEVSWNLVANNYAHGSAPITPNSGGGVWLAGTHAWVHHNTVAGNTGDGADSTYGGGVVVDGPGSPTIEQNIIAFSTNGGGVWCGNGATPQLQNNFAWQNSGGNGVEDCPNWWQSDGNIVDDPHFCDAASGDFRVASNSGVMTHPAGPLGAFPEPGCGPVAVFRSTWGSLKIRYR